MHARLLIHFAVYFLLSTYMYMGAHDANYNDG